MKQSPDSSKEIQKRQDRLLIQAGIDRAEEISRKMKSGEIRFPKGVFRFKTLEEADEWENNILAGHSPQQD